MIFITSNIGPNFDKIPESLLFSVLERYIRYDSNTRRFFSERELKELKSERNVYDGKNIQTNQNDIIKRHEEENWEIDRKIKIKGCPTLYLKKDKNKKIILMAMMDEKIYVFTQMYRIKNKKKIQKTKEKKKTKVSGKDVVKYFHIMYVLYKNGTNIFEYRFRKRKYIDSDLLTSILTAIGEVLKEATGNLSSIREINQGNLYIILEHEKTFSTLLMSDSNKSEIKEYLKKFNQLFIKKYKDDLINWTGEISKFKGTEQIINKLFDISDKSIESTPKKEEKREKQEEEKEKVGESVDKKERFEPLNILEEEKYHYYYCISCKQWYKVDYAGQYDCLYCGQRLVDKTENVKKLKEREQEKEK
ncbi:MAG: hypothetical protein GF329_08170 [Candidatus Lokiarchaeota archaeon]|nr:hypothetical protein [Candidatus Lokiarchaeota archaeon]